MKPKFQELQYVVTLVDKSDPEGRLGWVGNSQVFEIKKGMNGTVVHAIAEPREAYLVEIFDENWRSIGVCGYEPDEIALAKNGL